jgi:acetyl-CoA carboxylase beta subunit
MTARERIDLLLDPGSFVEFDEFVRQIPTAFRRWWSAQAVKFEVRRAKLPDTAGVQRAKPLRD